MEEEEGGDRFTMPPTPIDTAPSTPATGVRRLSVSVMSVGRRGSASPGKLARRESSRRRIAIVSDGDPHVTAALNAERKLKEAPRRDGRLVSEDEVALASAELATAALSGPDSNSNLFVFDCTAKAIMILEDTFSNAQYNIIHTKVVFSQVDDAKGMCKCLYDSKTQSCTLDFDFKMKLKFAITFEGNVYRGWITLVHMSRAKLAETDFGMDVYWDNGISPKGIVYNQTTSVLISPRSRERIRKGFRDWEEATVSQLLGKMQALNAVDMTLQVLSRPQSRALASR
jgi:hypothetical protein